VRPVDAKTGLPSPTTAEVQTELLEAIRDGIAAALVELRAIRSGVALLNDLEPDELLNLDTQDEG
jgi:hypothetical protein